jgi:hypothetical protein
MIKANGIAVYVIQVDAGMDSWADYYIAGNLSEGAVWGGHGYTYIVMVNAEA